MNHEADGYFVQVPDPVAEEWEREYWRRLDAAEDAAMFIQREAEREAAEYAAEQEEEQEEMEHETLTAILDVLADAGRLDLADALLDALDRAGILPALPVEAVEPIGLRGSVAVAA